MCTGAELAAYASTTAAVAGTGSAVLQLTQGDGPDPAQQRAEAEAAASREANARLAARSKALQASSLLTGAGAKGTFGG